MADKPNNTHQRGPMVKMMAGDKAKDFKGTFKQFLQYMGTYKISVLVVMFFAVLSTVFMILGPKILGMQQPFFLKVLWEVLQVQVTE